MRGQWAATRFAEVANADTRTIGITAAPHQPNGLQRLDGFRHAVAARLIRLVRIIAWAGSRQRCVNLRRGRGGRRGGYRWIACASGDEGAVGGGSHFPVSDKTLAGLEGAHCRFGPAAVLTINGEVQTK